MTTVQNILDFLETIAPDHMKYDWDNAGLLCGSREQEVKKILVALDPFEHVALEAEWENADLLVTHHPLIFRPVRSVTNDTSVGRSIRILTMYGISAVNAHTNLDRAPGGVNDILAETLGLHGIEVIEPAGTDGEGRPWGLLRMGEVPEQPMQQFLSRVKTVLQAPGLRYADGGKAVCRVAVGGGACADELQAVHDAGCDTFVTADVKYNQFWDAHDLGLNLIDAGHFYTENPVCAPLARKLQAAFPEIEVILSKKHQDCMNFF